jgi:hypothetical protein
MLGNSTNKNAQVKDIIPQPGSFYFDILTRSPSAIYDRVGRGR